LALSLSISYITLNL